jgi:hypothetical protein
MNIVDLVLFEELLTSSQDQSHEIFVDLLFWWHIVLDYKGVRTGTSVTYGSYRGSSRGLAWTSACPGTPEER